jgi:hypothetical protein
VARHRKPGTLSVTPEEAGAPRGPLGTGHVHPTAHRVGANRHARPRFASTPAHGELLYRGCSGSAVREVQEFLNRHARSSPTLAENGVFDVHTEAAVRHFQTTKNIRVDGFVGPETWGYLLQDVPLVRHAAGASVAPAAAATPKPPPTPRRVAEPKEIVCELLDVNITCEHKGRPAGPEGILMVVPSSTASIGDNIKANVKMKGACGEHPKWVIGGFWNSSGKGSNFDFQAQTWVASGGGFVSLEGVSPHSYQVWVDSCAGTRAYEVRAYPPGKVGFKIDLKKIFDTLREILKHVPIPEEELDVWTKEWFQGSIQYEGAWKEDEKSWKAYYEKSWSGQFDPLIGGKYKGPIYPITLVPGWLQKWVKAGLFFEIKFSAKVQAAIKGKHWPDTDKTRWDEKSVAGGGGGGGGLSLELKLASSEIVEGAIGGDVGVGFELKRAFGEDPKIEVSAKFEGIKGTATLKAMWGYVEFSRTFQLVKEREVKHEWELASEGAGESSG